MPIVTNGRVIYVQHPTGHYEPGVHTKYVEEQLDTDTVPLNGGVLIKALLISADPYMRYRMRDPSVPHFSPPVVIGQPLDNFVIGTILRSEDPKFAVGDYVSAFATFETYPIYPGPPELQHFLKYIVKIPKPDNIPLSIFLGTCGLPGKTAYTGWKIYGESKAKTSKTLFVSGAAGPLGTFVVEYAKITSPHLKVIACAGSQQKVDILKSIGADVVFNYKEEDANKVLAEHGPIDIYWDNVAGPIADAAIQNLNMFGLIIACGAISGTGNPEAAGVKNFAQIFQKVITVHGFLYGFGDAAQAALGTFDADIMPLVASGKITSREQRYQGLKEAERALAELHSGKNVGKSVIVVAQE